MIIPLRTPDGLPDVSRLDEWTAACDRCDERRPLGECDFDMWVMGQRTDGAVYCPPCVKAIAAELLDAAFRPGLPARLIDAVGKLVASVDDRLRRSWRRRHRSMRAGEVSA